MATKNKAARMIVAAYKLKKLNASADEVVKTLVRAFEAEDVEEVIDALDNADETTSTTANDDMDTDLDLDDEEILDQVEAKVNRLKSSVKRKSRRFI